MADFAGLAIAGFDKIWLVGSKIAEIITDYRHFDEDSFSLAKDVKNETQRTKTLRCLLFEPSTAYNGQNLFSQFDDDVQFQIQDLLRELLSIITEGADLLERQQVEQSAARSDPVALAPPKSPSLGRKKSAILIRVKWSFWEKGRLESILKRFSRKNKNLERQVQLVCHATSVGVKITHLDRLTTNEHSIELGFDAPAQLQLNVTDMATPTTSLQLHDPSVFRSLMKSPKIDGRFAVLSQPSGRLLVEFRSYAADKTEPVPLGDRPRERVEKLAHLLQERKDPMFHIMVCQGWMLDAQENQVAFLFSIPESMEGTPISLLQLYNRKKRLPPLGERLRLAKSLASSICQLHLVKWVHESFRSENILFFLKDQSPLLKPDIAQPWVMDFEFSRPEQDFSSGRPDKDTARNVYRHPERQRHPQAPFAKKHDIYALGVVLLEIGLWQPVLSLEKNGFENVSDLAAIKDYLIKQAEKSLPAQVGENYKRAVVSCLTGIFVEDDNKEDLKLQQAFRAQILDVLDKAAEFIG